MLKRENSLLSVLSEALTKAITAIQMVSNDLFEIHKSNHGCYEGTFVLGRIHKTISVIGHFDGYSLKLLRYPGKFGYKWKVGIEKTEGNTPKDIFDFSFHHQEVTVMGEIDELKTVLIQSIPSLLIDFMLSNEDLTGGVPAIIPDIDTLSTYMSHMWNIRFTKERWTNEIYPAFLEEIKVRSE